MKYKLCACVCVLLGLNDAQIHVREVCRLVYSSNIRPMMEEGGGVKHVSLREEDCKGYVYVGGVNNGGPLQQI